ncbi:MAG: hypothetical protein ONB46_20245 [candidate division KSB1 bacterium]|nr:hypothetical protein [candidate division KSB1 bacterium]MDZ7368728.1 hypothetical protein [candidate division KSB1 bacterium]MDZ7406455.1 hypothetical protein [candidate division KSB1 bacterium]
MSTTVQRRRKKLHSDSKKQAALLIRELSEEKIKAVLPFLEFLKFLDQSGNGKEFDATNSLKQGIKELAEIKAGKLRPKPFEALLNEL